MSDSLLAVSSKPILLRGGSIITEDGERVLRDILVKDGTIVSISEHHTGANEAADVLECTGRIVLPGFVDAHSHAGVRVFDADVQRALLRQGVTTVVSGQDGVGPAPGDGAYGGTYFAAIDGAHPPYAGGGVAALLATYDGTTPLNVAYLVPAGTVRHEIMGDEARAPSDADLVAMRVLVRSGLAEGAVGLSSGLDYAPGLYADTAELATLCAEVAAVNALYVSHMRGGYEANARVGITEMAEIVQASGVRAHVSHLHAPVDLACAVLAESEKRGAPLSFDAYPYSRGCTILMMLLLPPALAAPGTSKLAAAIATPEGRAEVRAAILERVLARPDLGEGWAEQITLSHVPAARYHSLRGVTLAAAAHAEGTDPASLALDVLCACELQVTAIMRVPHPRAPAELAPLYRLPMHSAGSDGIFVGAHPHPRAYGTFAKYLGDYVRPGLLGWADAAAHLSANAVEWYRLGARGRVAIGAVADLIVVDPEQVAACSTYEKPMQLAVGIDDVLVAGVPVLRRGELTGATPGRGLRRR
jgi:N-acyl-D-amino-acid deacylase